MPEFHRGTLLVLIVTTWLKDSYNSAATMCSQSELLKFMDSKHISALKGYADHGYTSRGLVEFIEMVGVPTLPFQDLLHDLQNKSKPAILEIGCGAGKFMLDLQAHVPSAHIIGLNKRGWEYAQLTSNQSILSMALYFNKSVPCTEQSIPIYPDFQSFDGIGAAELPFPSDSFDAIVSMHALNKLHPRESMVIIPRVARVLRPGGVAMLSLLWDCNTRLLSDSTRRLDAKGHFSPLLGFTVQQKSSSPLRNVSIVVYSKHRSIGLLMKVCNAVDILQGEWGCFASPYTEGIGFNSALYDALYEGVHRRERPGHLSQDQRWSIDYSKKYLSAFWGYISGIRKDGHFTTSHQV